MADVSDVPSGDRIVLTYASAGAAMDARAVRRAMSPLGLIFWGGILCVVDISFSQATNGQGFRCDIVNDVVGSILIAVGVFRLSHIPVHERYAKWMKFVRVVSVLAVLDSIREVIITPWPAAVHFAISVLGLADMVCVVAFCVCMRWFCEQARLVEAARSWRVTTALFGVVYLLPLGLLYAASAVAVVSGTSFNVDLGPGGLLLIPVFVVPLVHLFVSTSRMKRAAEGMALIGPPDPGDAGGGAGAGP